MDSEEDVAGLLPMDGEGKEEVLTQAEQSVRTWRDPFRSFVRVNAPGDPRASNGRSAFSLRCRNTAWNNSALRAFFQGPALSKALMEDDAGKGYSPVEKGDLIGDQGGRIVEIQTDRIIIEEQVKDVLATIRSSGPQRNSIRRIRRLNDDERPGLVEKGAGGTHEDETAETLSFIRLGNRRMRGARGVPAL